METLAGGNDASRAVCVFDERRPGPRSFSGVHFDCENSGVFGSACEITMAGVVRVNWPALERNQNWVLRDKQYVVFCGMFYHADAARERKAFVFCSVQFQKKCASIGNVVFKE